MPNHSLSQQQAATLVSAYLKGQGPATVHFHVGVLQPSVDEKIRDPHYRLLAERQLVGLSKVTMSGRDIAYVQFTWKWAPNEVGNTFDAAGPLVKSFNTWDRSTLIQNYGVAFYHVEPAQAALTFVRGDKGRKLAAE